MQTRVQKSASITTIRSSGFDWFGDLPEVWAHSELLYFLVWRDIKVRYKQTALGVAWAVLQPLAIALSISLLLGRLVPVPQGELPYPAFAYTGMALWQLFAQVTTESSNSLLANERLLTKVYFPRLLLPLAAVLASLVDFAVSLVVLAGFLLYFRIEPRLTLLLLPAFALLAAVAALGIGLWLSALNVKYRDVRYTIGFLIQFGFFVTPVAYPISAVPARLAAWYALNPMVGAVEGFRWAVRGSAAPPLGILAISAANTVFLLLSGWYFFHRTEATFADYL